jgi:hypothetical protein
VSARKRETVGSFFVVDFSFRIFFYSFVAAAGFRTVPFVVLRSFVRDRCIEL